MSNGEDIRVRGYLKPISTLRRPLASVDFATREPVKAAYERSDVCVVPAAGVAAEAMVALTLARCALEKFGGDSMLELQEKFRRLLPTVAKLLNDLSHREIRRSGAGEAGCHHHRVRRRTAQIGRRHVREHVRRTRSRPGRSANRYQQAHRGHRRHFQGRSGRQDRAGQSGDRAHRGPQTSSEGCLSSRSSARR